MVLHVVSVDSLISSSIIVRVFVTFDGCSLLLLGFLSRFHKDPRIGFSSENHKLITFDYTFSFFIEGREGGEGGIRSCEISLSVVYM